MNAATPAYKDKRTQPLMNNNSGNRHHPSAATRKHKEGKGISTPPSFVCCLSSHAPPPSPSAWLLLQLVEVLEIKGPARNLHNLLLLLNSHLADPPLIGGNEHESPPLHHSRE